MNTWIEQKYAERLIGSYQHYRKLGNPYRLNCRCPVCGDSASDQYKTRFWCYYPKHSSDQLYVGCFNCDYKSKFIWFMKNQDEPMYRDFLLECRKDSMGLSEPRPEVDLAQLKSKRTFKKIETLPHSKRIDQLSEKHPIVKYLNDRCIPKDQFNRMYFTPKWKELTNSIRPDTYDSLDNDEPRLVIPIYDPNGNMVSIQGRALKKNSAQKYITIKVDEDATKVYGMDRLVDNLPTIVLEGPIDSMFLDNAIAITGGSINLDEVPNKSNRIWVMDNEPRSENTLKRIRNLIESGETVLIWDKCRFTKKDINDMIRYEGATKEELMEYITKYSCSGLMAKHRLSRYAKVSF